MEWLGLLKPLIGLASQAFERSTLKEKKKYIEKLANLEIELGREMQKPLAEQNDGLIEDLLLQIQAITKVAEHETRIVNNS